MNTTIKNARVRGRLVACLACAVIAGVLYPYGELAWTCRVHPFDAEACVWARAYFPLSRWVEFAFVTPTVFVLMMLLLVINGRTR